MRNTHTEGAPSPDFRLLFEACPHPYLVLLPDAAFTIIAVNDHYLAATGTQRELIVGQGLFTIFPDNPDDLASSSSSDLRVSLNRVRCDRQPDIMGVQKYDILRQDGAGGFEVKYWSPVNTPVFDQEGCMVYIIHHVEDVTEFILTRQRDNDEAEQRLGKVELRAHRMQAEVMHRESEVKEANRNLKTAMEKLEQREAELARVNERLKELDRVKTEFFSNVSHEFRTPLTLMLGPLDHLLEQQTDPLPASGRTALEVARRNALRLLKLVNTLLDFSRIEAGRAQAFWEATDLAAFTADLASNFHSTCETGGIEFVVDCQALPQAVAVDRDMWEKIVLNLISNAFKFTLDGRIEVRLRAVDGIAVLTVSDTGVGIPAHELPNLFQRFHRIAGSRGRAHEGSGIGLALVKQLIEIQGGSIQAESEPDQGSRFIVRLPIHAQAEAPVADCALGETGASGQRPQVRAYIAEASRHIADRKNSEASPRAPARPKGCILLADDNRDMREYIQRLLTESGYAVTLAQDGEQALNACLRQLPDLVLSDVMMPRLDGFGLLARLRAHEASATLPVILLSARAGEEARVEGLKAGADDYLVKPFHARELVARVDGAIRLARARREAQGRIRLAASVFDCITEGVLMTDPQGVILTVNPAFCALTGFGTEELLGQNPRLFKSDRHDDAFYTAMWRQLLDQGSWKGDIWNQKKNGVSYLAHETISSISDDEGEILYFVGVQHDVTEIRQQQDVIRHQALHDALTNLPNRLLFMDRLQQELAHCQRDACTAALLFVDLDKFKPVNDTLGHDVGDSLLVEVAKRLSDSCSREIDTVARLGGDEFVMLLSQLAAPDDAARIAARAVAALANPFMIKGHSIEISGSIGIAVYPRDGESVEVLLAHADKAMYQAKQNSRNVCPV